MKYFVIGSMTVLLGLSTSASAQTFQDTLPDGSSFSYTEAMAVGCSASTDNGCSCSGKICSVFIAADGKKVATCADYDQSSTTVTQCHDDGKNGCTCEDVPEQR